MSHVYTNYIVLKETCHRCGSEVTEICGDCYKTVPICLPCHKPLTDEQLETLYTTFLDEQNPTCNVAGYEYKTSFALRNIDPNMYWKNYQEYLKQKIIDGFLEELNGEYYTKH